MEQNRILSSVLIEAAARWIELRDPPKTPTELNNYPKLF
jgi:hypothetical protein